MNNKIKNLKKYVNSEISMPDFLYNFCGISDSNVFHMSHFDVKKLLPYLKRCSFEMVYSDSQLVYTGDIILVRDYKHNVVPYFNPLRYRESSINDLPELERVEKTHSTHNYLDVKGLSNYELKLNYRLQKRNKSIGKYKMCRLIKKEMHDRGIENSGSKRYLLDQEKILVRKREE